MDMRSRVLIIEDDPASLELLRYLLDAAGYRILTATRGDVGLEMALQARPDAIICDIQLPERDGYAIARELRGHADFATIPLIAMTALAMVGDRDRVLSAGFSSYVSKPIDPANFLKQLARLLGNSAEQPDRRHVASTAVIETAATALHAILVVDDSPVNLQLKRSIFEPSGYRVLTTDGVAAALTLARSEQPSVILSDIQLGEHDGFELLEQVKADPQLHHIPFVFITSTYDDAGTRERAYRGGADGFLVRPMEPGQLLRQITAYVDKAGASNGLNPRHR